MCSCAVYFASIDLIVVVVSMTPVSIMAVRVLSGRVIERRVARVVTVNLILTTNRLDNVLRRGNVSKILRFSKY